MNRLLSKLYSCGKFVRRSGARILMYLRVHSGSALLAFSNFSHKSEFGKKSNRLRGFALVQALFFMMFIMAVISVAMLMSAQRAVTSDGERMAIDVYPLVNDFVTYAQSHLDTSGSMDGSEYFSDYPLSQDYIDRLAKEGISNPSEGSSLTLSVVSS